MQLSKYDLIHIQQSFLQPLYKSLIKVYPVLSWSDCLYLDYSTLIHMYSCKVYILLNFFILFWEWGFSRDGPWKTMAYPLWICVLISKYKIQKTSTNKDAKMLITGINFTITIVRFVWKIKNHTFDLNFKILQQILTNLFFNNLKVCIIILRLNYKQWLKTFDKHYLNWI